MGCHKRSTLLVCWGIIASLFLAGCGPAAPTITPAATATSLGATVTPTATPTFLAATSAPLTNAPPTAAGRPTSELTITIIYDNMAYDTSLQADWGFAALIQYGGHTVLFDTGASGQMLASNMDKLGIDPKRIEAIVLSHAHADHVNGLQALLDKGITPKVYALSSFDSSLKDRVRARTSLVEVNAPLEILPGLYSTGKLGTSIRIRDAFLDGYAQVRTLPEAQLKQLDLFMAAQYAQMVLWASAFIRKDPARRVQHEAWRNKDGNNLVHYLERLA